MSREIEVSADAGHVLTDLYNIKSLAFMNVKEGEPEREAPRRLSQMPDMFIRYTAYFFPDETIAAVKFLMQGDKDDQWAAARILANGGVDGLIGNHIATGKPRYGDKYVAQLWNLIEEMKTDKEKARVWQGDQNIFLFCDHDKRYAKPIWDFIVSSKEPFAQAGMLKAKNAIPALVAAGYGLEAGKLIRSLPEYEKKMVMPQIIADIMRPDLPAALGLEDIARPLLSQTGVPGLQLGAATPG